MTRENEGSPHETGPREIATQGQPQEPLPRRPLPKVRVLTLADDGRIGGDPYNTADRWARPHRRED